MEGGTRMDMFSLHNHTSTLKAKSVRCAMPGQGRWKCSATTSSEATSNESEVSFFFGGFFVIFFFRGS